MNPKKEIKMIEANAKALILIAWLQKKDDDEITVGRVEQMLMAQPYNMTQVDARKEIESVPGVNLDGDIISSITLSAFASEKKVLSRNIQIKDFLPKPIIDQLKTLGHQGKVSGLVWLMDERAGYWIYQSHVYELLRSFGLTDEQIRPAISQAFSQKKGYISKPSDVKKGQEVILAPGKKKTKEVKDFLKFFDKHTKDTFKKKEEKKKSPVYRMEVSGEVDATVVVDGKHTVIDIVSSAEATSKVEEIVKDFAGNLAKI